MKLKIRIVQILMTPNTETYQCALMGLGEDGVVYTEAREGNESGWAPYLTPPEKETPEDSRPF